MKKTRKALFWGANIVLPLTEGRSILKAISYAAEKQKARIRALRQAKTTAEKEGDTLTFDEVMARSPHPEPVLIRQFLLKKRIWLALTLLPVTIVLILNAGAISTGTLYPVLFWRLVSLNFMLTGFTALTLVKAVQSQFYLWQLRTRTLAPFSEWRRTTAWLKTSLSWKA